MIKGNGVYYYSKDGLGSVVNLTDNIGNIVESYSYDEYGNVSAPSQIGNRYLYTGREYDPETGLYYYRARYYDPSIGRFLQTDPIGYIRGINLYTYCKNNPVNWIDPDGLIVGWPYTGWSWAAAVSFGVGAFGALTGNLPLALGGLAGFGLFTVLDIMETEGSLEDIENAIKKATEEYIKERNKALGIPEEAMGENIIPPLEPKPIDTDGDGIPDSSDDDDDGDGIPDKDDPNPKDKDPEKK